MTLDGTGRESGRVSIQSETLSPICEMGAMPPTSKGSYGDEKKNHTTH